jgi:hypothetical protein
MNISMCFFYVIIMFDVLPRMEHSKMSVLSYQSCAESSFIRFWRIYIHTYTTKVNIGICFSIPISYLKNYVMRYWSICFFYFLLFAKAFGVYTSEMLFSAVAHLCFVFSLWHAILMQTLKLYYALLLISLLLCSYLFLCEKLQYHGA